jgi:hypothetical protein
MSIIMMTFLAFDVTISDDGLAFTVAGKRIRKNESKRKNIEACLLIPSLRKVILFFIYIPNLSSTFNLIPSIGEQHNCTRALSDKKKVGFLI